MNYQIENELNVIGKHAQETAHIYPEQTEVINVSFASRVEPYYSGHYIEDLVVKVTDLPQWMRKGGALGSSILTYIDGSEGNLRVVSQRRSVRFDGTEELEMEDRKHSNQ